MSDTDTDMDRERVLSYLRATRAKADTDRAMGAALVRDAGERIAEIDRRIAAIEAMPA